MLRRAAIAAAAMFAAGSALFSAPPSALAQPAPEAPKVDRIAFEAWKADFRDQALAAGVTAEVFDRVMAGVEPRPRVVELDKDQPEFVRALWDYLDSAVSDRRIADGKANFAANRVLLKKIEDRYKVDADLIVAVWGLESAYGAIQGDFDTIEALATIAFDGRRARLGKEQLIAAMKIVQFGYARRDQLKGSWAGAMGQTQFLPTTYLAHAVDDDGDGDRDIWTNLDDVLASTANFLAHSGWRYGAPWGMEVKLPAGFDYALADRTVEKAAVEWGAAGVTAGDGSSLLDRLDPNARGAILVPAGADGPAFLVLNNFDVILKYNNSTAYALAVGMLSDRIAGRTSGLAQSWPRSERPLTRTESVALQEALKANGYDPGPVDGIIGAGTRRALRLWQAAEGLIPDGFASAHVLERLQAVDAAPSATPTP